MRTYHRDHRMPTKKLNKLKVGDIILVYTGEGWAVEVSRIVEFSEGKILAEDPNGKNFYYRRDNIIRKLKPRKNPEYFL